MTEFADNAKEAAKKVKLTLDIKYSKTGGAVVLRTYKNAMIYLRTDDNLKGLFRFNVFNVKEEITRQPPWEVDINIFPKPITDVDILNLKSYLIKEYSIEFATGTLNEAVTTTAHQECYDPVKNYLQSLKWDKKPRLTTWLTTYMGVELDAYSQYVARMTLCAACARVDKPGIKYDHMMVIEGKQNIGKSLAVEILGGEFYREISLTDRDKETVERMQGAWIIEVAEMAAFRKRDIESLKAFITCRTDVHRLPYGRRSLELPRRNIFIGTINPDNHGYLSDTTGNRRFLPVECSDNIDIRGLRRDKDQLWAEAWAVYKTGKVDMYISDPAISDLATEEQKSRQTVDEWSELIKEYVKDKDRVMPMDIWTEALKGFPSEFDKVRQLRVGDCMRFLGWEKKSVWYNDKTVRAYFNPNAWKDYRGTGEKPWDEMEEDEQTKVKKKTKNPKGKENP